MEAERCCSSLSPKRLLSRLDQLEWFTKAAWNQAVAACTGPNKDCRAAAMLFSASADLNQLFPTHDHAHLESEKVKSAIPSQMRKQTLCPPSRWQTSSIKLPGPGPMNMIDSMSTILLC